MPLRLFKSDSIKQIASILLFLVFENSSAQEALEINSIEQANTQIENHIQIYKDTTNALDINQISNLKGQNLFLPLDQFKEKRSSKNTYWLYFSIDNNLEDDYPIGLVIPKQDHLVDVYSFTDSIFYSQKSGFYMDAGKNDEIIPFSNTIQIRDAKGIDFYLKIKNINDQLPDFSIKFVNLEKETKLSNRLLIFDGFAQGMMWLMIMYSLFLFFLNKDKLYLYYSLYIILSSVWYLSCLNIGLGFRLFPELPRVISPYSETPMYIGMIFYLQFIRLFINSSQILPKWDKTLKLFQILVAIESLRNLVFIYLTNLVILNFKIANMGMAVMLAFYFIFIIKLSFLKSKLTNIVAIGCSFLVLALLLGSMLVAFFNDSGFLILKIGILSELIVFTFGLSYRYALIEADKQKFQTQLIAQLSENAELHQKVNRELADKVKERTIEIEKQRDIVISQKDHIEKINTEMTDSIKYAKYIQSSVLPKADQLDSILGEHFILYKPKDIVSGDFYWTSKIDGKIIISAVDCTGHGVPGAFMSMLGMTLLNEIINKEYITHPGVILRRLRKEVINSLKQKGERGEQKDGMDISLCTLDPVNMKLQFAGANNPLYLIRKSDLEEAGELRFELTGDDRLYEIKGDMMPIGIYDRMEDFTMHEINIFRGDSIYLFTDGFPDQFGGPDRKKFGYRQFRELLLKFNSETMADQKNMLEKNLTEWMGDNIQIDDILVIGFRIG